MNIMDLALQSKDWEWCAIINEISRMSPIELIEEELQNNVFDKINEINRTELEYYLPQMIHVIDNSDKYPESFLKGKMQEMKLRYRDLIKDEIIREIKESRSKSV